QGMPRAPRFGANPTHYVQLSGLVKAQDWRKISSVLQVASDFRGPVWREVDAALSGQVQVVVPEAGRQLQRLRGDALALAVVE
ncbi:hypothetical protein, partial [Salmonella sp. SAL04292]|uniref:hypothetical protein n=1 Tax=Salmonella sp. SAL04292 TaxID=3159870 RepID=UPI0039793748